MEFRLLGPLEIWISGNRIEIGRPLQRRLVAALSLAADRAVHRDELIEAMWDARPPSTCRQQLQNCVHALRRLLGESVIDTASGGYRLVVDPSRVDVHSFGDLVRQARRLPADRAAPLLRRALGLWRGPALAGMGGGALRAQAEALEEHRLTVLEECAGLELDLGGHTGLIAELKAVVAEHPTRERLVGHLMVAMYRSGRQSDALEVFHRLRKLLTAEQGVTPSVPLQRVYESVLRQDGQLAGRRVEVEFGIVPERARTMVVVGMTGADRTSVAMRWARQVRERFPDGQCYVDLFDHEERRPLTQAEALGVALGELGVPPDHVPPGHDGRAELYQSMLADRRVVIVLDNATTTDQVRPLLPTGEECLTIVTSREALTGMTY